MQISLHGNESGVVLSTFVDLGALSAQIPSAASSVAGVFSPSSSQTIATMARLLVAHTNLAR